jgi:hypothetical protein
MELELYKKKASILEGLEHCVRDWRNLDPCTLFDSCEKNGKFGIYTKPENPIKITLPGPKESSNQQVHLEITERYEPSDFSIAYYRYEIWWRYEVFPEKWQDEYCPEVYLGLRKTIRFDHDPTQDTNTHPVYHWHPNGSELRLPTVKMTTRRLALFALRAFDPAMFEAVKEKPNLSADAKIIEGYFFPLSPA